MHVENLCVRVYVGSWISYWLPVEELLGSSYDSALTEL